MQIQGIGIYNGRMAQYRDGGSGFLSIFLGLEKVRWQNLEPGNETDIVEARLNIYPADRRDCRRPR